MTEDDARAVLLVRAFEASRAPPWRDEDAAWAATEATRACGTEAAPPGWAVERARRIAQRLAERAPAVRAALHPRGAALMPATAAIAALVGLAGDAVGAAGRIHILAPPLLLLVAWNLAVYALLALRAGRGNAAGAHAGSIREAFGSMLASLARWRPRAPALATFATDWWHRGAPLHGARVAAALHLAAAALAAGVLGSMYARGMVLDFRAGWDSTFLDAADVGRLIGWLLGPAAALTATPLPDAAALEGLRFAAGGGANAAPWIHLWALTVAALVIAPRLVLAALATLRARSIAHDFPLELTAVEHRAAARATRATPLLARVLPYGTTLEPRRAAALEPLLVERIGGPLRLEWTPTVALGGEDDPERWQPAPPFDALVLLFALVATPEREHHGAFVEAASQRAAAASCLVVVDESAFIDRFTGEAGERRRAERREAWRTLLAGLGHEPWFVDLGADNRGAGDG